MPFLLLYKNTCYCIVLLGESYLFDTLEVAILTSICPPKLFDILFSGV